MEIFDKTAIVLNKKLRAMIKEGIDPTISQPHIYLLRYLRSEGRSTVTALANHLGITLSAVTCLTNKLFDLKMITRVRCDSDRRLVYVDITDKGKSVLEHADENVKRLFNKYFSDLPSEEIHTFFSVIDKITRRVLDEDYQGRKMEDYNETY